MDHYLPTPDDLLPEAFGNPCPVEQIHQDWQVAFREGFPQLGHIRLGVAEICRVAHYKVKIAPFVRRAIHAAAVGPDLGIGKIFGKQLPYGLQPLGGQVNCLNVPVSPAEWLQGRGHLR